MDQNQANIHADNPVAHAANAANLPNLESLLRAIKSGNLNTVHTILNVAPDLVNARRANGCKLNTSSL